jgi:hypothetical protein
MKREIMHCAALVTVSSLVKRKNHETGEFDDVEQMYADVLSPGELAYHHALMRQPNCPVQGVRLWRLNFAEDGRPFVGEEITEEGVDCPA